MMGTSLGRPTRASRRPRFWPSLLAALALVLSSLSGLRTAFAQLQTGVDFSPIGGSRVTGTSYFIYEGQGIGLGMAFGGLASHAPSEATMTAGTCAQPGTSPLWVLSLTVDERGRAQGSGIITIGGRKATLADIADGRHIIVIRSAGQAVACGVIPALSHADVPSALLAEGEREQVMQFNPAAGLQKRIFADGFVPNSPEFRSTLEGTTFGVQRSEHLRTGAVRVYFAREGDWANVRFYQRGAPADSLGRYLLDAAEQRQVIQFNPRAALQTAIFADGFVPNSGEFHLDFPYVTYTAQRAEHLSDGRVRVYYAVAGQWNKVWYAERQ